MNFICAQSHIVVGAIFPLETSVTEDNPESVSPPDVEQSTAGFPDKAPDGVPEKPEPNGQPAAADRAAPNVQARSPEALFKAYVEFAKVSLSNVFLINAGSATALIAFLGKAGEPGAKQGSISSGGSLPAEPFISNDGAAFAIAWFAVGALCAILGSALMAFQENMNSARVEKQLPPHAWLGFPGVCLLVGGGVAFLIGCSGAVKVSGVKMLLRLLGVI